MVYQNLQSGGRYMVYETLNSLKKYFFIGTGSFLTSQPAGEDSGR
jgi:hypothetical protein